MTQNIQTLLKQVNELKNQNDWLGIYNKFNKLHPIKEFPQNDLIWNNHEVLNDIGFACAKLAETGSIPPEIFNNRIDKEAFLKQQAEYRKYAEQTRKRCIELEPEKAGYRSNLAYTYYQNITDLTSQRGRRDGNLREEIENFITTVDVALRINPKRVNDLYRKGRILTRVLPNQILWSNSYEDYGEFVEKLKIVNKRREEGIQTLLSAKKEWESLRSDNQFEEKMRKDYKKYYIKSLYALSRAYCDKIREDWDESVFTLNLRDDIPDNQQVTIDKADKENIEQAIQIIKECCRTDCPSHIVQAVKQGGSNLEKIASHSGEHEGVEKLYLIGKFFFAKYWILSGYGLKENDDAIKAREIAERYLQAALKCKWSSTKAKKDKLFVVERLARLFISKGEYDQATSIVEENTNKLGLRYAAPYVLHTCALSLLKANRIDLAHKILDSAAKSIRNHG